jgi:hypothetical protein
MYADFKLTLRSNVTEDDFEGKTPKRLEKEAVTIKTIHLDMSCSPSDFQSALQTLLAQNITTLMSDAFDDHPASVGKVKAELKKAMEDEKAKAKKKKAKADAKKEEE